MGDGHDQDQDRAGVGLCACRPRLGEQEAPRAGGLPDQPVVRLDTGHGQGRGHAVPRRDRPFRPVPSGSFDCQRQRLPADLEGVRGVREGPRARACLHKLLQPEGRRGHGACDPHDQGRLALDKRFQDHG